MVVDSLEVGRECDGIIIEDGEASRRHFELRSTNGRVWVSDLGSTNGTTLNGTRITSAVELREGDVLIAGATEVRLWAEPEAVVISWWSFSTPLWYGQHVEGRRPDVTVLDDRAVLDEGYGDVNAAIEAHLDERPVYVIRLDRDLKALEEAYLLELVPGVPMQMYRVVAERANAQGRAD